MEQLGFKAVIEDLEGYLRGAERMQSANEALSKSAIASAAAAAKQSDALVKSSAAAAKAAAGTTEEAAATAKLTAAQTASVAAHSAAASAVAKAESSTNKLVTSLKSAAGAAAVMLGTFVGFQVLDTIIGKTTEWGKQIYLLQQITGLSAESLSGLLAAGEKLGIGYDKISAGLRLFARNMTVIQEANDGFTGGAKTTTELLKSMGITVLDVNGNLLPMQTLLNSTADWFAKTGDNVLKAGVAAQLFSRNGAALLPILNLGSKGMADVTAQAKKLGLVLSQDNVDAIHAFTVAQNEAKGAMAGLEVQVGNKLLPVLTRMFNFITDHQKEVGIALAAIAAGFVGIGVAAVAAAIATNAALAGIPILLALLVAGTVALVENWSKVKAAVTDAWGGVPSIIKDALSILKSEGLTRVAAFVDSIVAEFNRMKDLVKALLAAFHGNWSEVWKDLKDVGVQTARDMGDQILIVFGGLANQVIKLFQDMMNKVIGALNTKLPVIGSLGIPEVNLGQISQPKLPDVSGVFDAIGKALSGLGKKASDAGPPLDDAAGGLDSIAKAATNLAETLAGAALAAVRTAASSLFSQPTQQEASLNVSAAQAHLASVQVEVVASPQLDKLDDQLTGIKAAADVAAEAAQKNVDAAQANASAVQEAGQATVQAVQDEAQAIQDSGQQTLQALQDSNQAAQDAADAQLRVAQNAAQTQADGFAAAIQLLQDQLATLQQNRSSLQAAFKAQNEALQQQINAAIGRGDTAGALRLVGQQKGATSAYNSQDKALQDQEEANAAATKAAQREAQEAAKASTEALKALQQSTADAAKAQAANTKAIERQVKQADDAAAKAVKEAEKQAKADDKAAAAKVKSAEAAQKAEAADAKAKEKQVQSQIDILKRQEELAKRNEALVTGQTDLLKAQHGVWQAQITAADKSLLSEEQLRQKSEELRDMMGQASTAVLKAAQATGFDLVADITKAQKALQDMNDLGITASTDQLAKMADKALKATSALDSIPNAASNVANALSKVALAAVAAAAPSPSAPKLAPGGTGTTGGQGTGTANADGGIYNRPTLTWVGETFQREAIIPLERPSRAREVLAHIPPALLASIMPGRRAGAPHQIFGDLNVQGYTLEDMEAAAHRQISAAFRGARTNAYRTGALIGQGVGAGSF